MNKENNLTLSGLEPLVVSKASNFINVGERTNVTGSKKFLRLIENDKYSEALEVARDQVEGGAQIIDINMDEGLIDGSKAMLPIYLSFFPYIKNIILFYSYIHKLKPISKSLLLHS